MQTPSEDIAAVETGLNEKIQANATLKDANDSLTAENAALKESALTPEALAALARMVALVAPPAGS